MSKSSSAAQFTPATASAATPETQVEQQSAPAVLLVEAIMTSPVFSISTDDTVREAIKKLLANKIAGAPVIDSTRKVMSVVSEGDLLRLAATMGLDRTIFQCMIKLTKTEKLITVKRADTYAEIYKKFLAHPVHRLIVVDEMGRLDGIVSRSNVLRVLVDPGQEKKSDEK
jgi:CBS domain-containing protein